MKQIFSIAVLGRGHLGHALGTVWSSKGHKITFGVRDPKRYSGDPVPGSTTATIAEASAACEIVALCVPWPAAEDAIRASGNLNGKIIVDATNPVSDDLKGLIVGPHTSAGEMVAGWAPQAHVVKAFNTLGAPAYTNTHFGSEIADGFYCGDHANAKAAVKQLKEDAGLNPVDVGPLANARLLEPLAMLWIDLAINQGLGVNHAFKLLRR